jgi:hypothetical protein
LLTGLVKYDSTVLERVCNRYITDVKISGKRGLKYVLKMAEGISSDDNAPKIDEQLSERMASKRKEEGELKFAVKLATGKIDDSLIYKRLLKTNEISKLNYLWKKGMLQLRSEGRLDEIDKGYDWLEKD